MNKLQILITFVVITLISTTLSSGFTNNIYLPIILNKGTPQPPPPGEVYITNDFAFIDGIDILHIVGEVVNETSKTLFFTEITANLYDNNGMLIYVDFTFSYLENLPPYEKTCFEILFLESTGWSYYEFEPVSYHGTGIPVTGLTALNVSGSYYSPLGWYIILGEIRNDNPYTIKYVSPIITLYNGTGNLVDCDMTGVNSTHLNPGQKSSFKNTSANRDYSDVTNYRIQVNGYPEE